MRRSDNITPCARMRFLVSSHAYSSRPAVAVLRSLRLRTTDEEPNFCSIQRKCLNAVIPCGLPQSGSNLYFSRIAAMVVLKPHMETVRLPQLVDEIMLDVFTHRSLLPHNAPVERTNNCRLALVGQSVLEMTAVFVLFLQDPCYSVEEIRQHRRDILSDDHICHWVRANGLLEKLRALPSLGKIESPEDLRFLFYSYIGALFVQADGSNDAIRAWMNGIINPASEPPLPPSPMSLSTDLPAYPSEDTSILIQSSSTSVPHSPVSHSGVDAAPPVVPLNTITVALVNQTAVQRGVRIHYSSESSGPSHLPIWTVRCLINDEEKGVGTGSTKKSAELEAGRQAYLAMHWGW